VRRPPSVPSILMKKSISHDGKRLWESFFQFVLSILAPPMSCVHN
jgi:hypothetical protein